MALTNGSLHQTRLNSLFKALDPKSLILSQFQSHQEPNLIQLTTESFVMERGPRYKAYAELRESKLRMKNLRPQSRDHEPNLSPPKKQVKFQGNFPSTPPNRRKGSSVLAQSVPDFPAALRKENRRPAPALPPVAEKSLTPPLISKRQKKSEGSWSAEKRSGGGGVLARKSYANMEELKGFSSAAANAINRENRGVRSGKSVLGYRQY